jgi:hypothetical protein
VFDDGDFDEDNTFLAGGGDDVDWQAHKFVGERREPVGLSLQALIRLKRDPVMKTCYRASVAWV